MRRMIALATGAGLVAVLTACSSTGSGDCGSDVQPGRASSIVEAAGEFGAAPEVSFPDPLVSSSIEKSVLLPGEGEPVRSGQPVLLEATILSGADGSVLNQTAYAEGGGSIFSVGAPGLPALGTGLECTPVGSRVAIVASGEENAAEGSAATSDDSVVYVVDVLDSYKAKADGINQLARAGMPSVVTAPDGTPGITVPNEEAPAEYAEAVLKSGQGAVVTDEDVVVVKYTSVDWETGTVAESTWLDQSLDVLDLGGQVSPALLDAVEGETVGSQVLAVVPAETDQAGTLVYVVDILGTID